MGITSLDQAILTLQLRLSTVINRERGYSLVFQYQTIMKEHDDDDKNWIQKTTV